MNQRQGLPDHLFNYVSSITPLANVDIIIVDTSEMFLLTWRDDGIYGPGWHVPGGIIRFKESVSERIHQVCKHEAGCESYESIRLVQINQVMNPTRDYRGHFISFLFIANLGKNHKLSNHYSLNSSSFNHGDKRWFKNPPVELLPQHRRYLPVLHSLGNKCLPIEGNLLEQYTELHEKDF